MIHAFLKRILDITGASLGLLAVSPFVPFIAAAILWESPGPVVVKLSRVSRGKVIKVYKFRSMVHGAHAMKPDLSHLNERRDGPFFKIRDDPRLTRTGKLLRKFRLDEFPQLVNVLSGELALVGPRPHEPEEVIHYPGRYQHLLLAKAGVTGLSQVSGASSLPFMKELELDSHYVQHPSLATDAKIIGKTIGIIFSDPTAV